MTTHDPRLTRHSHSTSGAALVLPDDHPAVLESRPLFRRSANEGKRAVARLLVSAHNSRKIGKIVTKGELAGFHVYTLTLTERTTCPRDCQAWNFCMGNRMPWSLRWPAGKETEDRIEVELAELQAKHPDGFLIRLHALGDFMSVEYVRRWRGWLTMFPALHVYGYTARHDEIGRAVAALAKENWKRFAIRSSYGMMPDLPATFVVRNGDQERDGIRCPVETGASKTCGTCALCWAAPDKTIIFHEH